MPEGAVRPRARDDAGIRNVAISDGMIRLGQLLKLAGLAGSGAEAKALLAEGAVTVNGAPEMRRGRQLHPGDVVGHGDEQVRITPK